MTVSSTHKVFFLNIRKELCICLFFVISILAVYWQTGNYDFVDFDDDVYVFRNPYVRAGLTLESIRWAFTATHAANWHPVTWLSHILDVELYGLNPGQHHLSNVIFHIANTLLLFFVFRQMSGKIWQSAFVAALFALHPLHVESVAWVSERKDVLSTFFWLLTMRSYLRFVREPKFMTYLPVLLFFILGLMSKPMLITLPFVLLLLDCWPLERLSAGRAIILEKIPLIAISGISLAVTFLAQKDWGAVGNSELYPFSLRISNALISYIRYIGKLFRPSDMAFFYPYSLSLPWWEAAGAGILLVFLSVVILRNLKHRPYLIVGWLWYLGTLVPVIGLVQLGGQSMADRYTYIPFIGLSVMAAWGIPELTAKQRHEKILLASASAAVFTILMLISSLQVRYWRNSITLFEHALAVTDNNYVAHNNLGVVLHRQGKTDEAIAHYSEVLRIKPRDADAHNNIGVLLADQGKTDEAVEHYTEALRLDPGLASAYNNMGIIMEKKGDSDAAVRYYSKALQVNPDYPEALNNMGLIFYRKGEINTAIAHFRHLLRIKPDSAEAHNTLGAALVRNRRPDEAIAHFRKALELKPDYVRAYNNLKRLSETRK